MDVAVRELNDGAQLPPVGAEIVLTTSLDLVGAFRPSAVRRDPGDITRFPLLEVGTLARVLAHERDSDGAGRVVIELLTGRFETLRVWVSAGDALSAWTAA